MQQTIGLNLSTIIAPSFHDLHRGIKKEEYEEVWCKGGRGSTKSTFISLEIVLGMMQRPGANAVVGRRYDNELRDSVFGQLRWSANKLGVGHLWRFMVSPMQASYTPTGQKIIFRGADNPLKIKSINLGQGYIKYAWFEEVDQFGGFGEVRNILQSLFRGEDQKRVVFFSYNPPKTARSWVNHEATIPKQGRVIHHSDYLSVPAEWLGERFITDAEHLKKTNEISYRHEYLGEQVGTGLEVFNNVELRKITDDEIKAYSQIRQGLDFGYAVDPVCFLRVNYDRKKRRAYLFGEISGLGISNRVLAEKMADCEKRELTISDNEPKSIDELKGWGLVIKKADKPPGSVDLGVKWLADLEKIVIDPERCPLAAKEFINYAFEITRNDEVISRYPDKENHAIDALRYALNNDIIQKRIVGNVRLNQLGL